jgi:microcystin-dependent protein
MTDFKVKHSFAAGTKAKSAEVNQNFDDVEKEINEILRLGQFMSGDLKATARATAPDGWLLCDGAAISRTTYRDLFDAIVTTYGVGDGATTFNVPDMRGRVPVGEDGSAGRLSANDALGRAGGEEKHTLTEAELASHGHGDGSLATGVAGDHSHSTNSNAIFGGGGNWGTQPGAGAGFVGNAGNHSHDVTGSTSAAGGGSAHNNMQPFQVVNWLVKI